MRGTAATCNARRTVKGAAAFDLACVKRVFGKASENRFLGSRPLNEYYECPSFLSCQFETEILQGGVRILGHPPGSTRILTACVVHFGSTPDTADFGARARPYPWSLSRGPAISQRRRGGLSEQNFGASKQVIQPSAHNLYVGRRGSALPTWAGRDCRLRSRQSRLEHSFNWCR